MLNSALFLTAKIGKNFTDVSLCDQEGGETRAGETNMVLAIRRTGKRGGDKP